MSLRHFRVHNPFEVLIAILCLLSGIPLALNIGATPDVILRSLPLLMIRIWGAMLSIGGTLILIGLIMRRKNPTLKYMFMGLNIERAGLAVLGSACASFAVVVITTVGWKGTLTGGTYVVVTLTCFEQMRELRDVKQGILKAIRAGNKVGK